MLIGAGASISAGASTGTSTLSLSVSLCISLSLSPSSLYIVFRTDGTKRGLLRAGRSDAVVEESL